jgi:succinyl-CoA synthetase beta subunit
MNIHEYQAKKILKKYGIPVPEFAVASSLEEVERAIEALRLEQAVLKIQVHAGGRGKAGGVQFASSSKEILLLAKKMLGMKMVNQQTGPAGIIAKTLLIAQPIEIEKEYYVGALVDRARGVPLLIVSPEGGMDIEEIAHKMPEKLLQIPFGFDGRLRSYQLLQMCKFMGWSGDLAKKGALILQGLARCFIETDADLLEINPLIKTKHKELFALDAKLSVDDNALFRQLEIASFYDPSQLSPQEAAAKEFELAYIAMHGNIGCMVNGAGLAMATMDIIHLYGGEPANFLDVGGGASKEKVAEGFRIILSDPNVKAILVNIFGGIMNCAILAEGVIHAAKEQQIKVPIVVRMEGTNVLEGKKRFQESHLKIKTAENLKDAAKSAVDAARRS